jgi:hypothetical protein
MESYSVGIYYAYTHYFHPGCKEKVLAEPGKYSHAAVDHLLRMGEADVNFVRSKRPDLGTSEDENVHTCKRCSFYMPATVWFNPIFGEKPCSPDNCANEHVAITDYTNGRRDPAEANAGGTCKYWWRLKRSTSAV